MNALVMYDHQTRTLWSQFLRKGVEGELKDVELDVIPVTPDDLGHLEGAASRFQGHVYGRPGHV